MDYYGEEPVKYPKIGFESPKEKVRRCISYLLKTR